MTTQFPTADLAVLERIPGPGGTVGGLRPKIGVQVTLWTAKVGGVQVTALLSPAGASLPGYVTTDADGRWDFSDPANRNQLWAQLPAAPGQPLPARVPIYSAESLEAVGTIGAQFPGVVAAANAATAKATSAETTANTADSRSTMAIDRADEAYEAVGATSTLLPDVVSNAYRKRILHNLVYQHSDWDGAQTAWAQSLYPQAFCIDEDNRRILTMSQPGIVSEYDYDSGAYLGLCYKITTTAISQSIVVRTIGGIRYLYARTALNTMSRFNITNPAKFATLPVAQSWTFPLGTDFDYRHGFWTCINTINEFAASDEIIGRHRFARRDDAFTKVGHLEFPMMQTGGPAAGAYQQAGMPKSQGVCEGFGVFATGTGGGWISGTNPRSGRYYDQGIRVFSAAGDVLVDSLVPAWVMFDQFAALGYQPSLVEQEGTAFGLGKFHTLYCLTSASSSPTAVGRTGGLVLVEELAGQGPGGVLLDLRDYSVSWTIPDNKKLATGLFPVGDDKKLYNLLTGVQFTTLAQILTYMRDTAMTIMRWYNSGTVGNILDINGTALTGTGLVEVHNISNTIMLVMVNQGQQMVIHRCTWDGTSWSQVNGDTGWIDCPVRSGFAAISASEKPQVRRIGNRVKMRGGILNTGLTATANFNVADLPAATLGVGFQPPLPSVYASPSSAAVSNGIARVDAGVISVRTPATVGGYYHFINDWFMD